MEARCITHCVCYVGVFDRTKKFIFRTVRRLPYIGKRIDAELKKQKKQMEEKFHEMAKGQAYLQKLPAKGMSEVKCCKKHLFILFFVFCVV